jgi:replicative DNA helicase
MQLINHEAEIMVLSTFLYKNEMFYKFMDTCTEDIFTTTFNKMIFKEMSKGILERGKVTKIELVHMCADEDEKELLALMAEPTIAILNLKHNIAILCELARKRKIKELAEKLVVVSEDDSLTVVSKATAELNEIFFADNIDTTITFEQEGLNLYDMMDNPEPEYTADCGLNIINAGTDGGFQKGRVYAFLAPAKAGKTLLATTISNGLVDRQHKHLFVCAEMSSREIAMRMYGQRMNVPAKVFYNKNRNEHLKQRLVDEHKKVKQQLIFENDPGIEFDRLQALIEKHVYQNKIEGFVLDYYQLVSGQQRNENEAQHLEKVANWMHKTCKKLNIWCVLLVQANDDGKILGSRGLSRACDQMYSIERERDDNGDPIGNNAWLKMKISRYTPLIHLGDKNNPSLYIHNNGTHFEEI